MLIRNAQLANSEMILRSNRQTVLADANGVFEVPEVDGEFLLSTGRPWEPWNGPFTRPVRTPSAPAGAPPDMVRQFEEAVASHRDRADQAERELAVARKTIVELQGQLAEAQAKLGSPAVVPPTVISTHEIAPPAPATGEDKATEELDLNALEMPELLQLADEYSVKLDKRWGIDRVRKELADHIFEKE